MRHETLVVGATGFVGQKLVRALVKEGTEVVLASRHPPARHLAVLGTWRHLDVDDPSTFAGAMDGISVAYYLVHGMEGGAGYAEREARAAKAFAEAAEKAGVERIVYLGGPRPAGTPSRHLASRLRTGQLLRAGRVPVVELQASMIIGAGSASFRIVRDLGVRLPVMVLPKWLDSRSQPVAIDDVVTALVAAGRLPGCEGVWGLPGPDTLSAKEMLRRVAAQRGTRPLSFTVPFVTPRLSAVWIELVTRSHGPVARELVEGLRSDLLCPDEGFWRFLPGHRRLSFDEAVARALQGESETLPIRTVIAESLVRLVSRRAT